MNYPFKCELLWAADKAGKELYKCSPFTTAEMHCVNALVLNPACYLKGFFPFILWRIASNLGMSSPPVAQWNSATPLAGLFIDPAWKGPNIHYQVHLVKMVIHSLSPPMPVRQNSSCTATTAVEFPSALTQVEDTQPCMDCSPAFQFQTKHKRETFSIFLNIASRHIAAHTQIVSKSSF